MAQTKSKKTPEQYAPSYHDQTLPFHPEERLVGTREVAEWTGMTEAWVRETFSIPAKGGIRPMKIGRLSKWPTYQVRGWLADREREAQS